MPPNASPGTGFGTFVLDATETTLTFNVSFGGLVAPQTAAHIHEAPPGVPGPIRIPLPLGSPISGSAPVGPSEVAALKAGNLYVNVHSTAFPGGEIRGQLRLVPEPASLTLLVSGLGASGLLLRRRRRPGGLGSKRAAVA